MDEDNPFSFFLVVIILSYSFSQGHERPYSCVDFKGSTNNDSTGIGQSESTSKLVNSESTNKLLLTNKSTDDDPLITPLSENGQKNVSRKEESVQYAVFCPPSHQTCGQGDKYVMHYQPERNIPTWDQNNMRGTTED